METIFRFIARWLASVLERYADPELQARLDAYNERVRLQEQKVKDAEDLELQAILAYDESVKSRTEWEKLLTESEAKAKELEQQLRASQDRVRQIQDEAAKAKRDIDSRPDDDVLRGRL